MSINLNKETWKPIKDFPDYEVSDLGRVRSWKSVGRFPNKLSFPKILKLSTSNGNPYFHVGLCIDGKSKTLRVHILVLEAFVGPCPEGMEACHLDDDKSNNKLDNLRWDTHKNNCKDRDINGKHPKGHLHKNSKLTKDQVINMFILFSLGARVSHVCNWFNIHEECARRIKNKKSWKHFHTGK